MKKTQAIVYIILILIISTIVLTNKAEATTGKVTAETLNLRSEPSTSSSIITLLNADEELEIISEEGNWYKVKYGSNEGYVSKDYIELNGSLEEAPTSTSTNTETTSNETSPTETSNNIQVGVTAKLDKDATIKILPLINSNTLGTISSGEEVTIISKTNKWLFIQTNEISGWIVNTTITNETTNQNPTTPEDTNEKPETPEMPEDEQNDTPNIEEPENSGDTIYSSTVTKYINASSVYVRKGPSTSDDIITTLIKNTDVTVTGENGDWYKVEYGSYTGYIYKELLSDSKQETTNRSSSEIDRTTITSEKSETEASNTNLENPSSTETLGAEISSYAKQYLNCPYVYGGSGPSTFDCSGFTMYVYNHFGYSLSHSAIAQSKCGTYVEKENLQPGDLVFFLEWDTMDEIGHCGIYIGDGNFIHASSGTGYCVKISTLLSGSYATRYATARRLI